MYYFKTLRNVMLFPFRLKYESSTIECICVAECIKEYTINA